MAPNGFLRGGVYRRWRWKQSRSLALALFPIAPVTLSPGGATVTVVANDATLVAAAPPMVPLRKLHTQQANVWALYRRAGAPQRPSALATLFSQAAAQSLVPGAATVTVVANDATLNVGVPPYQPLRRPDVAVRWTEVWDRVQQYRFVVEKVVPVNSPMAASSAVVTVVANDASLTAPPPERPFLRAPDRLASRWAAFQRPFRVAGPVVVRVPLDSVSLTPAAAVVTVVAQDASIAGPPPTPSPAIRLRARSMARYWSTFLDPFPQIAGRGVHALPVNTTLIASPATVTVSAQEPGITGTATLAPPSAVVTVVANDASITQGSAPATRVVRRPDLVPRWHLWRVEDRPLARRKAKVGLVVAPPQFVSPAAAVVSVGANDATLVPGVVLLQPPAAVVGVVAQSPVLASSTALQPPAAVVTVVANDGALAVSAVSLTPGAAIVTVFSPDPTLVGGAPSAPVVTGRRWWRRYYDFSGGGGQT